MSYFFSYQVAKVEFFLEMEVLLKAIIKEHSQKRTKTTTSTSGFGTGLREDDFAKEIAIGGAIVFTLDVEDVDKY